jgi:protein associated with RNAse G/E
MALKVLDPVQGLIDYVNDIKPYHSKVIEALIEYVGTEFVDVTILEDLQIDIAVTYGLDKLICPSGYGTPFFGDPESITVLSPDTDKTVAEYPALGPNFFIVLDDRTDIFDPSLNLNYNLFSFIHDKIIDVEISAGSPIDTGSPLGSPDPRGSFVITGDKTSIFVAGVEFEITGSNYNDGDYTVSSSVGIGSPVTYTRVYVNEVIPSDNVEGFVSRADLSNTGLFGVVESTYNTNHPNPHTIVDVSGLALTTPALPADSNQKYVSYVSTNLTEYNGVLSYSRALKTYDISSPPTSYRLADGGIVVSEIANQTATSFRILEDFRSSNVFVGDELTIEDSTFNDGTYTITSLTYEFDATVGDYVTVFGVASVPDETTIDGTLSFFIPSNSFVIDNRDYTDLFGHGTRVSIASGTYEGTYIVLAAQYQNEKTYLRVRETLIDHGTGIKILSVTNSSITVDGDVTTAYVATQKFNVVDSLRNDGIYTTVSSSYDAVTDSTTIQISESYDGTDNSGEIHEFDTGLLSLIPRGYGASIDLCPSPEETLTNANIEEDFKIQLGYNFLISGTDSSTDKIYIEDLYGDVYDTFVEGVGSPSDTDVEIVKGGINNGSYTITNVETDPGAYAILTVTPSLSDTGTFSGSPLVNSGYLLYKHWFQYLIVNIDSVGSPDEFLVAGDATSDITNGMSIRTLFPNNTYTVITDPVFDGVNTTISVAEPIVIVGGSPVLTQWIISI